MILSLGTSNHDKAACHMTTAALIFTAEESGTLALIALATCNRGLMRSRADPLGGAKRGAVGRDVGIVRVPCVVLTLCPSAACGAASLTSSRIPKPGDCVRSRFALFQAAHETDAADESPKLSSLSGVLMLASKIKMPGHSTQTL